MQPDLLDWRTRCEVLPFPAGRRMSKIRRVAEVIAAKSDRERDAYWKRSIADLARQLSNAGIERELVERELTGFRDAVQRELLRQRGNAA